MTDAKREVVPGLDHGTPPSEVLREQERIAALLNRDEAVEVTEVSTGETRRSPGFRRSSDRIVEMLPDLETAKQAILSCPAERVSLEFVPEQSGVPGFQLEFDVHEVCVREHYISLLVASDLGFKPSATMKFLLRYQKDTYHVIFAGAEFEFKTLDIRGISFLRDPAKT